MKLMKLKLLLLLLLSAPAFATDYYVANTRTSNGSGTQASPWKDWSDINWATVATALGSASVNIYFSSRDVWTMANTIKPTAATGANRLRLFGDQQYTTDATGTATWLTETTGSRSILTNSTTFQVGGFGITNGTTFVTISGFIVKSAFAGVQGIDGNPATNINNLTITNCAFDGVNRSISAYGVGLVYLELGCYSNIVTHCLITNCQNESIYIGHYNWMTRSQTNTVIEYCTVIDAGLSGQGDIDIKPGNYGAIVRYNTHYRTVSSGSSCGVVILADACQVYGNTFFKQSDDGAGDWGEGIHLNSDGDGAGNGGNISSCLIYNNLFYSNDLAGIGIQGTVSNLTGVKIFNNTFSYNGSYGILVRSSGSKAITISQLTNNILFENASGEISLQNSDCTITAGNYNLIYRASGNIVNYQGTGKTWAQWQALGFDANGVNSDPLLSSLFLPGATSPAVDAGSSLATQFTTDVAGNPRGSSWDIGAFEFIPAVIVPSLHLRGLRLAR